MKTPTLSELRIPLNSHPLNSQNPLKQTQSSQNQLAGLQSEPNSEGPKVLFVHGWLDNAASFASVLQVLQSETNTLDCVAIDLPGHGHSCHFEGFYPFHEHLHAINQVLTHLGWQTCHLVGHSMGAYLSACYAAAFPERVTSLTLIEGICPLGENPNETVARLRNGLLERQESRNPHFVPAQLQKPRKLATLVKRRAQLNQIDDELIEPIVLRGTQESEQGFRWRHDSKLMASSLYRMTIEQSQNIVAAIKSPTQVILGKAGFAHLPEQVKFLVPAADVTYLEGGHHCHMQKPIDCAQKILEWVNKNT